MLEKKKYLDYEGLKAYTDNFKSWTLSKINQTTDRLMKIKSVVRSADEVPLQPSVGDVCISVANFTYFESEVEPGDLFVYTDIGWTIVQGNIDVTALENMIPTKTSDLTNDSDYITADDIESVTSSDINDLFH